MNTLFEMHDWIPYLFSIGLLITVSYGYIAHLYCGITEFWISSRQVRGHYALPLLIFKTIHRTPITLARIIRRKEAPDEDAGDCLSSLSHKQQHQRGGTTCNYSRDSLLRAHKVVFTV